MTTSQHLAKHLREFISGPNTTGSHLKEHLDDITLEEANQAVYGLNTIAKLVYHINYYIEAVSGVLEGEPLTAKDIYSYDAPILKTQEAWKLRLDTLYTNLDRCASQASRLTDQELKSNFVLEKYGTYERNLMGLLEHSHYHFGQIVVLKKIIRQQPVQ